MPDQREARAARLFGVRETSGGLMFPEVFGAILENLIAGPAAGDVLHKIIREKLSLKSERVESRWGSWSAFCDDILLILQDNGFITEGDGSWSNTGKVIPGAQLTIVYDPANRARKIRITVHDETARRRTEAIAEAWSRARDLASWLEEHQGLAPVLVRARNKQGGIEDILREAAMNPAAADWEPDKAESNPGKISGGRSRGDGRPVIRNQGEWYRKWVRTAGWHTQAQVRDAWNKEHPDQVMNTAQASGFRHQARAMTKAGLMKSREGGLGERGMPAFEYRWTGE